MELVYRNFRISLTTGHAYEFVHDYGKWRKYKFIAYEVCDLLQDYMYTSGSEHAAEITQSELLEQLKTEIDLESRGKQNNHANA